MRGEERREGNEERRMEVDQCLEDGEAELVVVSLQGSNTLKASGFIWRTRIQKGNSVNISSSKTLDSSTSPTGTR